MWEPCRYLAWHFAMYEWAVSALIDAVKILMNSAIGAI